MAYWDQQGVAAKLSLSKAVGGMCKNMCLGGKHDIVQWSTPLTNWDNFRSLCSCPPRKQAFLPSRKKMAWSKALWEETPSTPTLHNVSSSSEESMLEISILVQSLNFSITGSLKPRKQWSF